MDFTVFTKTSSSLDQLLLRLAYQAATQSTDPNTHVGALITREQPTTPHLYLASHSNQLSQEILDQAKNNPELYERLRTDKEFKYAHLDGHAEVNAITQATNNGYDLTNTTMHMPWLPCIPCAIKMVGAGINKLVAHKQAIQKTPAHWQEELAKATKYLHKNQVQLHLYDGHVGRVSALMRDEHWNP